MKIRVWELLKKYGPILLILSIAIFFRLYNLTAVPPGLYPDEAMNGNNAAEALATGHFKVFYPENNGREGLFMNIQALFLKWTNVHEAWVLRFPSAIFGILTVLGIYLLALQLLKKYPYRRLAAGAASFLLAISFWHILFSRIGFRAIMSPAFMVWGLYLLSLGLELLFEKNKNVWGWLTLAIGGAVYGGGMYSYIAYRVTPLLIIFFFAAYWFFFRVDWKKLAGAFAAYVIPSLAIFAPLGWYFLKNPADFFGRTSELSVTASAHPLHDLLLNIAKTIGMFWWHGDWNWRQNYAGAPELYWIVGIIFAIGLVWSLSSLIKKYRSPDPQQTLAWWTMLVWFALAFLPVVISNEGIPHALRSILMIPPVFFISGFVVAKMYEWIYPKLTAPHILQGCMLIIAALMAYQTYYQYFILWAQNPNTADAFDQQSVDIGHAINQIGPTIPKYVVVNQGGVDVRGIPMPSQTVMFITDTFLPQWQKEKNVHYVLPDAIDTIPKNAAVFYLGDQPTPQQPEPATPPPSTPKPAQR